MSRQANVHQSNPKVDSSNASFHLAIGKFDTENARDPNLEAVEGACIRANCSMPERLSEWVLRLAPDASETLRLAARCQHIRRWLIPRQSHPMTRPGYLRWRNDLKEFHARTAGEILRQAGYRRKSSKKSRT